MKNFKILFVFSLMLFAFNCFSQHHLKKWYISPNQIDVTQIPGVTGISGATVGTDELCNGMYDPYNLNGPPMFYIAHDPLVASPFFGLNVYDATNTSMGQLQGYISGRSPEIAIVPFPDNNGCANNRYYIFISSPGPSTNELEFQVVDMNGNGGLGTLSGPTTVISIPGSEWGGIAVGPQQGGTRYLYFCGGSTFVSTGRQIDKITINSSGVTAQNILTDFNNFFDFETSEMDINPKSTMLAFASNYAQLQSPPRYYVVGLNANGNWNGVITTFNVGTDNNPGGRGVEFYEETNGNVRLLVGAGNNGIYSVNPSNPTVGQMQIVGSANYGHSQLEAGYNNSIYASSSNDMAAIDITGTAPVIDPAYNISIPAPSTNLPGLFYNLLDQIDVENYDLLAGKHGDLDLYMKDFNSNANGHIDDVGNEPNPDNQEMWVSNDLWTRQNQGQGGGVQEDPEYWMDPLHNNWVYVVIRNRSCVDYAGGAELYLYWAKASTALAWPINWDGSLSMPCTDINGVPVNPKLGNALSPIPSKPILPILANGSIIMEFPWHVPNPDDFYGCFPSAEYKHFCLLARIVSTIDPIGVEVPSVYTNTQNYNNIIWKNLSIMNALPGIVHNEDCYSEQQRGGGVVSIGNPFDKDDKYQFEFKVDKDFNGKPIFEQAEIKITLDESAWAKWVEGGFESENIRIKRESCRQLVITGSPAYLRNLSYSAGEKSLISLSFNFISEKVDAIPEFDYHVIQKRSEDNTIIGGELYRIKKPSRYLFEANGGGNKDILLQESAQLKASNIGESAYYNWYDDQGTLISSGQDMTVSPSITTKYKLEVIATSDGFTSYDSVIVHVKEFAIISLSPNPALGQVTVGYDASNASSGYITIVQPNTLSSNNYIINTSQTTTTLNLTGYLPGSYYIRLVCDGIVRDEKSLVIIQ